MISLNTVTYLITIACSVLQHQLLKYWRLSRVLKITKHLDLITLHPNCWNYKLISTDVIEPLAYIFNLSFSSGQLPHSLKITKVIPLHKKGDKDKPGNYRPISLLSIFDKVLEKLMFNRMYSFLVQNDISYKYQFGFRKGFSTSLALIELLDTIYFHRDNHDFLIGMFFWSAESFRYCWPFHTSV